MTSAFWVSSLMVLFGITAALATVWNALSSIHMKLDTFQARTKSVPPQKPLREYWEFRVTASHEGVKIEGKLSPTADRWAARRVADHWFFDLGFKEVAVLEGEGIIYVPTPQEAEYRQVIENTLRTY